MLYMRLLQCRYPSKFSSVTAVLRKGTASLVLPCSSLVGNYIGPQDEAPKKAEEGASMLCDAAEFVLPTHPPLNRRRGHRLVSSGHR